MPVNVTMVDKDGAEWLAGTPTEVNDLLAQGYRFKGQGPGENPSASDPPSSAVANPAPVKGETTR